MKFYLALCAVFISQVMAYEAVRATLGDEQCRQDEAYQSCGSACHPTCENYQNEQQACTLQCVIGCFCQEPLLRAVNGSCVQTDLC